MILEFKSLTYDDSLVIYGALPFFIRNCDVWVGVVRILILHKKFQGKVFCIALKHFSKMEVFVLTEFTTCIEAVRHSD